LSFVTFENKGITEIGIPWHELTNQQVIQLAVFEDEGRKSHGARDMFQRDTSSLPNKSFVSQRFGRYKTFFQSLKTKDNLEEVNDVNVELEKIIDEFKCEISRIGIENDASKTKFNELYNPENSYSPSYLMGAMDMTWIELITYCGFKAKSLPWKNRPENEIYTVGAKFVEENNISCGADYIGKCDNINYPSYWVICNNIGWRKFIIRYAYDHKGLMNFHMPWAELTNAQILEFTIFEDERNRFESSTEMSHRKSNSVPNQNTASDRFGGYKNLFSIIVGRRKS